MRRRRLKKLIRRLRELQRQDLTRDDLLLKLGAAKKRRGRPMRCWLSTRREGSAGHIRTFHFALDRKNYGRRGGRRQLLAALQSQTMIPVICGGLSAIGRVEQAFKELKNDLSVRPIYHQLETESKPIFSLRSAYCLLVTLKQRLKTLAPGLTARAVLEKLATMQMIDIELPPRTIGWSSCPVIQSRRRISCSCSTVEAPTSRSAATENHRPKHPRNRMSSYPRMPTFNAAPRISALGVAPPAQLVKPG